MTSFLLSRLREPSTYAGIASLLAGASFIPHVPEIVQTVTIVGTAVSGLLAVWLPEKKA